jgi:hypothetical protein
MSFFRPDFVNCSSKTSSIWLPYPLSVTVCLNNAHIVFYAPVSVPVFDITQLFAYDGA